MPRNDSLRLSFLVTGAVPAAALTRHCDFLNHNPKELSHGSEEKGQEESGEEEEVTSLAGSFRLWRGRTERWEAAAATEAARHTLSGTLSRHVFPGPVTPASCARPSWCHRFFIARSKPSETPAAKALNETSCPRAVVWIRSATAPLHAILDAALSPCQHAS
jgi:hypothetical protein